MTDRGLQSMALSYMRRLALSTMLRVDVTTQKIHQAPVDTVVIIMLLGLTPS
jgi:hypothetical protein